MIVGTNLNHTEIERVKRKTEDLIDRKISILLLNIEEYNNLKSNFENEPQFILLDQGMNK